MSKDYLKLPTNEVNFNLTGDLYTELKKILVAGTGITITFNDTTKTITIGESSS